MRNKDTQQLSSLYEAQIVGNKVLSEAMPPMGPGEMPFSPEVYKKVRPEGRKAMSDPRYGEAPYKQKRLTPDECRTVIYVVGKAIMKKLEEYPDKTYPGNRQGFYTDIVAPIVMDKVKDQSGNPLFKKSFAYHVGRNITDALEDVDVLNYWQDSVTSRGRGGKDLKSIVTTIEMPEEILEMEGGGGSEKSAPSAPSAPKAPSPSKGPGAIPPEDDM